MSNLSPSLSWDIYAECASRCQPCSSTSIQVLILRCTSISRTRTTGLGRYNWDNQTQVVAIKEALQARGIPCWIDVDPSRGMKQDIFDSMACAVQNSVVVCCFMTSKYQSSANCKLGELACPPGSTAVEQWLAFS